jgi:hypothetical protein
MRSLGDIARTSRLNREPDVPNVNCQYCINGQVPDAREDICLKPIHKTLRVPWRLTNRPPCPPLAGHLLKAILCLALNCLLLLSCFASAYALRSAIGWMPVANSEEVHRRAKKNAPRGRVYMLLVAPQGFPSY